ncbi:MAG: hypothetical protein E7283_05790 [Lachnospiraceae bacterium]|nr:hypothetical protein [Lachnospiraceae bacterium]
MTEEQKKVRKFYKDFQGWKPDTIGTWIGAGFLVVFMLIGCAIPVQEMIAQVDGDVELLGWMMVLMFGPLAGFLYLRPYTTYTENLYTNNAKTVRIIDKLKYVPIDLSEIRKMKVTYLFKFYAKIAPFCMLLQVLTSLHSYNEVTWKNVLYIFVMAFVWPVLANLPVICGDSDVDLGVRFLSSKFGKVVLVVVILLIAVGYVFFPRNLKDLFLDGVEEENATIYVSDVSDAELKKYTLTGEQKKELLALFDRNYVRVKVVHESSISEHYMGYFLSVSGNADMMFFYSEDVISIEGQQYVIYGDTLAEEFRSFFEEQ